MAWSDPIFAFLWARTGLPAGRPGRPAMYLHSMIGPPQGHFLGLLNIFSNAVTFHSIWDRFIFLLMKNDLIKNDQKWAKNGQNIFSFSPWFLILGITKWDRKHEQFFGTHKMCKNAFFLHKKESTFHSIWDRFAFLLMKNDLIKFDDFRQKTDKIFFRSVHSSWF